MSTSHFSSASGSSQPISQAMVKSRCWRSCLTAAPPHSHFDVQQTATWLNVSLVFSCLQHCLTHVSECACQQPISHAPSPLQPRLANMCKNHGYPRHDSHTNCEYRLPLFVTEASKRYQRYTRYKGQGCKDARTQHHRPQKDIKDIKGDKRYQRYHPQDSRTPSLKKKVQVKVKAEGRSCSCGFGLPIGLGEQGPLFVRRTSAFSNRVFSAHCDSLARSLFTRIVSASTMPSRAGGALRTRRMSPPAMPPPRQHR